MSRNRFRAGVRAAGLAFVLATSPLVAEAFDLEVRDPWIRLPPPKAHAAAYLTLENATPETIVVTGAVSEAAERVEIHRTVEEDGVYRMIPIPSLEIAPGEEVVLAPRGLHLMLIRPRALEAGETVAVELVIEGREPLRFEAEVRRQAGSSGDRHDHGGHP